jgi:hypothetical protein
MAVTTSHDIGSKGRGVVRCRFCPSGRGVLAEDVPIWFDLKRVDS